MGNEFLCFINCPDSGILLEQYNGPKKSGCVVVSLPKEPQCLDAEGMGTRYVCLHTQPFLM